MKQVILNHLKPLIFLWSTIGFYFTFLFQNIIILNEKGLSFGHEYVWSDWPLHVAIANIFALKDPAVWFSYHPLYAQGKFTYPFVSDFISGVLTRINVPLTTAFIIPSIVTLLLFITFSYFLFYILFNSKKVAILSIFIFLLSSGLGFLKFGLSFFQKPNLDMLFYPPLEYSKELMYHWGSGNVATGLLVPQRAFLLGITLGVFVLLVLTMTLNNKFSSSKNRKIALASAGVVAGVLPIVHPHSFIAVVIITGIICLLNIDKIKSLVFFFAPATLISLFFYFTFVSGGIENKSFFSFAPGWTSGGVLDFIKMWGVLWGLTIPTAAASLILLYKKRDKGKIIFFLGFVALFIISNLVQFQPTAWDNSKLFFWAYLGFSALSAYLLKEISKKGNRLKIIAIVLFFLLTATGMLEAIRLIRVDRNTYVSVPYEDLELAKSIRENTDPEETFLTGTTHDSFVMVWAARPILMGYAGWVQNFGFEYRQTEQDIIRIYSGGSDAKNLLDKYKISYVVVGPWERKNYLLNIDYFVNNFPIAFYNSRNLVFKVD